MLRLRCEQLENRDTPANVYVNLDPAMSFAGLPADLIAGFDGPVQVEQGDVTGDGIDDKIAVAQTGGSAHVVAYDGKTGAELGSFIAFDPSFRGGGHAFIADEPQFPATLLVVPGPGGGPIVEEYRFEDGGFQVVNNELLPFPSEFRGGLQVSAGPVHAIGDPPDAFFLPAAGGGPEFVAMNLETGAVDATFFVGDPAEMTGDVIFEPTGGTITIPSGVDALGNVQYDPPHRLGVVVQDGPVVDGHVDTRVYDVLSGADVTADFPLDGPPEPPPN